MFCLVVGFNTVLLVVMEKALIGESWIFLYLLLVSVLNSDEFGVRNSCTCGDVLLLVLLLLVVVGCI